MKVYVIERKTRIARPVDVVRAQFADMEHHASHEVHKGIRLSIVEKKGGRCRVKQEFRLLGMMQREILEVSTTDGVVLYDYLEGPNAGLKISFHFAPDGDGATRLSARADLPLSGWKRVLAPLVVAAIARIADHALAEDRQDLEGRNYQPLAA